VSPAPVASGADDNWALNEITATWWWNRLPTEPLFSTGTVVTAALGSNGLEATSYALSIAVAQNWASR